MPEELYHHGVLGQKWGIRRYQNSDGTLNSEGLKKKSKLDPKIAKNIQKRANNLNGNTENRKKVLSKMESELYKTKEGKAYQKLVNERGNNFDKNGDPHSLSYVKEDWSNPDKVMNKVMRDTKILDDYSSKAHEIGRKYLDDVRGATLQDLGYENTKKGRDYLGELGIVTSD